MTVHSPPSHRRQEQADRPIWHHCVRVTRRGGAFPYREPLSRGGSADVTQNSDGNKGRARDPSSPCSACCSGILRTQVYYHFGPASATPCVSTCTMKRMLLNFSRMSSFVPLPFPQPCVMCRECYQSER